MDPAKLRELLDVLRELGVKSASIPIFDDSCSPRQNPLTVEFFERPDAATPFVDVDGKPVDLDEGAGPLARDPDADMERANFPRPGRK